MKCELTSSRPNAPSPRSTPSSFAVTVTFVPDAQYSFGRQCTRDPPSWSGSHAQEPSVGVRGLHLQRLLGGGAVGDVAVELDLDRRGDPDGAPVADVERGLDLLLRGDRAQRARRAGSVRPSAAVAVPLQV